MCARVVDRPPVNSLGIPLLCASEPRRTGNTGSSLSLLLFGLFEFPAKHVHTRAHSFLWAGALWPFVLFAAGGEEASGAFPTSVTTWRTESATLRLSRLVVFVSYLCNYLLVVPLHQPQPPPHLPSPLFYRLVVVSRHPMPSEHKKVTGPRHCKTRRYAAVSSRCHQTPFLSTPHPLISYPPPPAPPLPKRRS